LLEEVFESVRHPFFDDVVKIGLKGFAEPALDVPP